MGLRVNGYARSSQTRETARKIGLCDSISEDLKGVVLDADLVVL